MKEIRIALAHTFVNESVTRRETRGGCHYTLAHILQEKNANCTTLQCL